MNPVINYIKKVNYGNLAVYFALLMISFQFLYPLLRMLSLTLMGEDDIINPVVNWIPQSWSFDNLRTALRVIDPATTMVNSTWFSSVLAISQTLVTATTGFALARYQFPLKNFWLAMIIVSFILPAPVMLIPRTMMAVDVQTAIGFQLIGTVWPQILMAIGGQGVYSAILILIFYNFTKMIPPALDEAASIDGAGPLQIFYHIILKLSISTLLVVFLFSFVWNWNETFITSTFLRDNIPLVPARLQAFASLFGQHAMPSGMMGAQADMISPEMQRINEAFRMAGTFISIIPLFILYMLVQKQFIKGIENTGLTGI